jgi:hypothetical protein
MSECTTTQLSQSGERWGLLEDLMNGYFFNPDLEAVLAVYATVAAHWMPGPPVWLMIVAPPGSAKTSVLAPLAKLPNVHTIDKVTPNTFLSGQIRTGPVKRNPSLLHRIGPSGIVVVPDFSTVLSMKGDHRDSVMADLRRIYDGEITKEVGTSEGSLSWKGRLTMLAAVTPAIDQHHGQVQALGERFLMVRYHRPGGEDAEDAAMLAMNQEPNELKEVMGMAVSGLFEDLPDQKVICPPYLRSQIAAVAEFVARARTHVARDQQKHVIAEPEPEAPTRLAQQLCGLAKGTARLDHRASVVDADMLLVRRVAFDCIPPIRRRVLDAFRLGQSIPGSIPASTQSYVRQDLELVGLVTKSTLSPKASNLLKKSGIHQTSPSIE